MKISSSFSLFRASCRIRTNDPEITNHVLWPTELKRHCFLFSGCKGKTFLLNRKDLDEIKYNFYKKVNGHSVNR